MSTADFANELRLGLTKPVSWSWSLMVYLSLLLVFTLSVFFPNPGVDQLQRQLYLAQNQPAVVDHHLQLTETYYQINQPIQAQQELDIVNLLQPYQFKKTADLQTKLTTKPLKATQTHQYWQQVTRQHPNYPDAWVQLWYWAVNHNSGLVDQYLTQVAALDPALAKKLSRELNYQQ